MTRRKVILVTCDFPKCTVYDASLSSTHPLYEVYNEPSSWMHKGDASFCPAHKILLKDE